MVLSLSPQGCQRRSLRTELLLGLAAAAAAAQLLLIAGTLACAGLTGSSDARGSRCGPVYLSVLVALDIALVVVAGSYYARRAVLQPLSDTLEATETLAAGDLGARVPAAGPPEIVRLAASVNRIGTTLVEGHARLVRSEKMASVGRLAAGVAHEIGNPLGAINGYAHLLRKRLAGLGDVEEAAIGIERESGRIDLIVRGLLDYARPRPAITAPVDLNVAVRCAVDLLRAQGTLHGVEVQLALDADRLCIGGNRHEIDQVFVNLLLNAIDAVDGTGKLTIVTRRAPFASLIDDEQRRDADRGTAAVERAPSPRVRSWLRSVGEPREVFHIVVADSGPGIPEADTERVFDLFYTTKAPGKGTGLGLAIVARIVEAHGGVVYVRRAREGGAALVLLFPAPPAISPTAASAIPPHSVLP